MLMSQINYPNARWMGTWGSGSSYVTGDAVFYEGSSYVALQDNSSTTPGSDDSVWSILASEGATGADGATGSTGATGATGQGVPIGGTTGQLLAKIDGTNYNDHWINPPVATITLTGNVTGSGTSSFATTIASGAVTNAMLAGSITASKLVGTDITTVGTLSAGSIPASLVTGLAVTSVTSANGLSVSGGTLSFSGSSYSPTAGSNSITTLGTIGTGTWNASVIAGQYGGTGVANTSMTLTLGGNMTTTGVITTLSGSNTGDQTSVSGNAGTATALQTARTINGVNFDGTAAITITAAAGTLTGGTLNSGVISSSLTSFGASPTFVTPALGTPASGVLTNCTGTASGLTAGSVTTNATITLTSDVTGTGTGSFATTISANSVTYSKFQQVAASSLVGNPTGSLANASGITLGASLAFSSTTLVVAAGGVTNAMLAGSIAVTKLSGITTLSGSNTGDQTITLTGDVTGSGTGSFAATVGKIGGNVVSIGGALTLTGAYAFTGTLTATTAVTFPTSGTLLSTTSDLTYKLPEPICPSSRSSLVRWLDAGQATGQTDGSSVAGTVAGFATYGTPNVNWIASGSKIGQPCFRVTNGSLGGLKSTSNSDIDTMQASAAGYTISFLFTPYLAAMSGTGQTNAGIISTGSTPSFGNVRLDFEFYSSGNGVYRWDNTANNGGGSIPYGIPTLVNYTFIPDGTNHGTETIYINGIQVFTVNHSMPAVSTGTNLFVGFWQQQDIYSVAFHSIAFTPQDVLADLAYWKQRINNPAPKSLVFCVGDSRTAGTGSTGTGDYPDTLSINTNNYFIVNLGAGGTTIEQTATAAPTAVKPYLSPLFNNVIVVAWTAYNSYGTAGDTGAVASTAFVNMLLAYEGYAIPGSTGMMSVWLSEIDAQTLDSGAGATFRSVFNANTSAALANIPGKRLLCDASSNATLGGSGVYTNATYFLQQSPNTVHLTNAGYAIIASLVGSALDQLTIQNRIGEYQSATIASGSAVSLTTATTVNITSVSLTAGEWDISGVVDFVLATATVTQLQAGTSSTSATIGSQDTFQQSITGFTLLSGTTTVPPPLSRIVITVTTTLYLVATATFSAGTITGYGTIRARRVR